MKLVVADSSALVALAICDVLGVLDRLFDEVRVPPAVFDEVAVAGKPHATVLQRFLAGKVEPVDLAAFSIEAGRLGRGEREAMALYKKLHADVLLIDDSRGRRTAQANGLAIMGSLGVLRLAKERHFLGQIKPYVDRLRTSDLYIDEALLRGVLRAAGE